MAPATIQKKTVFITGCSTGSIGWALTKVFLERDFHVFAGVRDPTKAKDLAQLSNVDLLEVDVTVSQTILQCKETVAERTGGKLDVLVSCSDPTPCVLFAFSTKLPSIALMSKSLLITARSTAPGSRGFAHF